MEFWRNHWPVLTKSLTKHIILSKCQENQTSFFGLKEPWLEPACLHKWPGWKGVRFKVPSRKIPTVLSYTLKVITVHCKNKLCPESNLDNGKSSTTFGSARRVLQIGLRHGYFTVYRVLTVLKLLRSNSKF
jgi:hypothetical protein